MESKIVFFLGLEAGLVISSWAHAIRIEVQRSVTLISIAMAAIAVVSLLVIVLHRGRD